MARARISRQATSVNFPRLYFDIEPDEEEIRSDMLLLERNIKDYAKPLQYSKRLIVDDVKETFRLERDPETGTRWAQLSLSALRVPRYGMLQRRSTNRKMYRAVTSSRTYGV